MKKNVGRPTVSKAIPAKSNAIKANSPKAQRPGTKKTSYPKQKRTAPGYSGPADYESYVEPSIAQNGGGPGPGAGDSTAEADRAAAVPEQGASLLSMFGGIDGLISIMGKAQQVFKLVQQMGPMFKMISSFTSPKAVTASLKPGAARALKQRRKIRR